MSRWRRHRYADWARGRSWYAKGFSGAWSAWPGGQEFARDVRSVIEDAIDAVRDAVAQACDGVDDAMDWVDDTRGFRPDDDDIPR
jgi:hypothetical protein